MARYALLESQVNEGRERPEIMKMMLQAFVEVGGKIRGADAKIVGNVVPPPEGQRDSRGDRTMPWWDEMSLVCSSTSLCTTELKLNILCGRENKGSLS
jgi:hypothetical protein